MASFTDLHPCPHCGSEMHNGAMVRHEPMCFKNPAVFALCRSALASLSDRQRGITLTHYKALRTIDNTLPARTTLQNMTGCGPWNDVLAAFGLLPPDEKQPCPHCGKEYLYSAIADHVATCKAARPKPPAVTKVTPPPPPPRKERKPINIFVTRPVSPKAPVVCPVCDMQPIDPRRHVCPEDPVILAWLAATLPDPADLERIITAAEYKALPKRAISAAMLTRYYGTWPALAARFGLDCRASRAGAPELTPAVRAVLHRLADELHGGEYGPSISEYQVYAGTPVRKAHVLRDAFCSWNAVLAAAGLQPGTRSQYYLAAHERRKAHFAVLGTQPGPVASRYERNDEPISREAAGLFIGDDDPRKANYKPPIIHTDHVPAGYVRVMIR